MPFPPVGVFAGQGIPDAVESQAGFKSQGSPEAALNQKVKNLIQKLGEAIHESVSESENIAGVVKNIRDQGFDVLLMLEATIGLNEVEPVSEAGRATDSDSEPRSAPLHATTSTSSSPCASPCPIPILKPTPTASASVPLPIRPRTLQPTHSRQLLPPPRPASCRPRCLFATHGTASGSRTGLIALGRLSRHCTKETHAW